MSSMAKALLVIEKLQLGWELDLMLLQYHHQLVNTWDTHYHPQLEALMTGLVVDSDRNNNLHRVYPHYLR